MRYISNSSDKTVHRSLTDFTIKPIMTWIFGDSIQLLRLLRLFRMLRQSFEGYSDDGDNVMMVTDLRYWWQNHYVCDFFRYVDDFSMYLINHQHLKLGNNLFSLKNPSPTSMSSFWVRLGVDAGESLKSPKKNFSRCKSFKAQWKYSNSS